MNGSGLRLQRVPKNHPVIIANREHHYSQPKGVVGRSLCYLVFYDGICYGSIIGGSATRFLPGRNAFFGVGHEALNCIVNNVFFHVEPVGGRYPIRNFVPAVIRRWRTEVARDWLERYHDAVIGFETLVEKPRTGECYRRDGWQLVGETKGYTCKRVAGKGTDSWTGKRVWDMTNLRPKLVFTRKTGGADKTGETMAWKDRDTNVHGQADPPPLPTGPYPVILADPPWRYRNWTDKAHGAAKAHYPTLTVEEICALPVVGVAADNALLFLWVTGPKLEQGLEVMKAWGFSYTSIAFDWLKTYRPPEVSPEGVWMPGKPYCGLGFRTRQATELCLLGKRGKGVPRKSASVSASIIAQRTKHSEKPNETYARIEELVDGPYLELFARQRRPGWDAWGLEAS